MLPEMQEARYGHALVFAEEEVYAIGGVGRNHLPLSSVEKIHVISHRWRYTPDMPTPRAQAKACASRRTRSIYVIGESDDRRGSASIECFSLDAGVWNVLPFLLKQEYKSNRTHLLLVDEEYLMPPVTRQIDPYDPGDKLLVVCYDNIVHPAPDVQFVSVGGAFAEDIKYDKGTSTVSTYHKRCILYDKRTKKVVAFSQSNPLEVDYMDLDEGLYRWKSFKFVAR